MLYDIDGKDRVLFGMRFGKQQYKRLTIVLIAPLLICGLYYGVETSKSLSYIPKCEALYDTEENKGVYIAIGIISVKCKVEPYNGYDSNRRIGDIIFHGFDSNVTIELDQKVIKTKLYSFLSENQILSISQKDINEGDLFHDRMRKLEVRRYNFDYATGYIQFHNSYEELALFEALQKGESLELNITLRKFLLGFIASIIPVVIYFLLSLLVFIFVKMIRYIAYGSAKN